MTPDFDFREKVAEVFRRMKALGIITSIVMVLLGICTVVNPFGTGYVWAIIAFVALLVNGIVKIVEFCKMPKGFKNGGLLALGILWILIALMFLFGETGLIPFAEGVLLTTIGFVFGFNCIFSGILSFDSLRYYDSKALAIIAGILEILVGMFVIAAPFIAGLAIFWIVGIYVIVLGVSLFVRCVSL